MEIYSSFAHISRSFAKPNGSIYSIKSIVYDSNFFYDYYY